MSNARVFVAVLAAVLLVLAACARFAPTEMEDALAAGLLQDDDGPLEWTYVAPGIDWSDYESVLIEAGEVAFRDTWLRDQNRGDPLRVRPEDVERILGGVRRMTLESFAAAFTDAGYGVVDRAGPGVLRVRPSVVEIDVNAPDVQGPGRVERYVQSAGEMTLDLVVEDAVSGAMLLRGYERRRDPEDPTFQRQTRVENTWAAEIILRDWARRLARWLAAER